MQVLHETTDVPVPDAELSSEDDQHCATWICRANCKTGDLRVANKVAGGLGTLLALVGFTTPLACSGDLRHTATTATGGSVYRNKRLADAKDDLPRGVAAVARTQIYARAFLLPVDRTLSIGLG